MASRISRRKGGKTRNDRITRKRIGRRKEEADKHGQLVFKQRQRATGASPGFASTSCSLPFHLLHFSIRSLLLSQIDPINVRVCVECVDKGIRLTLVLLLVWTAIGRWSCWPCTRKKKPKLEGREELSSSSLSPCALTTLSCHTHSQGFWTGGEAGRAWAL